MSIVTFPRKYPTPHNSPPMIVREDETHIPHDPLFKTLIQTFFAEFMEAFFPEIYKEIDFQSVRFLSEEVIPDALAGKRRFLDIVVEVTWRKTDTAIVIHVEPQSYVQQDFNERMFLYYSQLYMKLKKPIIPIAIFSYDGLWNVDQFSIQVGDFEFIRFQYLTLHLRSKNWRDFIRKENPVSAVLMSQMRYDETEKVELKLEFLRLLQQLTLDEEDQLFLYRFFDTYVKLTRKEEEEVMAKVRKDEEAFDLSSLPIAIEEWAKEVGRKEGLEEGQEIAQEKTVLKMLKDQMPIEKIAQYVDLSKERIIELKKKL